MRLATIIASILAFFNVSASFSPVALDEVKSCVVSIVHSSEEINPKTIFVKKSLSEQIKSNITHGTGFIYRGNVITNFHVLEQALKNKYKIFGCTENICIELKPLALEKGNDLAMLSPLQDFECKKSLSFTLNANEGDEVVIYGNKFGLGGSFLFGHISALNKNVSENEVYNFIDVNVGYGNSGGAVFLKTGEIMGVLKSLYLPSSGGGTSIAFTITADETIKSIEKMNDMLEFEKTLEFEILEENDDIYLLANNENVYFENLPFSGKIQIQSINKRFVSSKVEVLHDVYNFILGDDEALKLTQVTRDKKLRNITFKKQRRIRDSSVTPDATE